MSSPFQKIQPEVAKQTKKVAILTGGGVILMLIVFFLLHMYMKEKVPFDYTVVLGGICGGIAAVLNFLLMGLTIQNVVTTKDEDLARSKMKAGYSQRMLIRALWVVAAIVLPCFHYVAGILPLIFPNTGIKLFYKWMADDK
ncbi:MAG: ATP synthase subunit I [Blautia sp.]|nr:ATP synthase subunit I [Blautia sp.]